MNPTACLRLLCLVALLIPAAARAVLSVSEPGTVFYGQVINRSAGHEQTLTSGTLAWTITDGTTTTALSASIETLGNQSVYRLEIPHSLAVSGLDLANGSVPLGTTAMEYQHVTITVDGAPAVIRSPGRQTFSVEEIQRAATFRLDLEISTPFTDSDGDGMPDWWEDKYGLNKSSNDAALDKDTDGINNLAEYLALTHPGIRNTDPLIFTSEVIAMADSTSALMVRTLDSDTSPAALVYHITSINTAGLSLNKTPLAVGSSFTQAEVNAGRLRFTHPVDGSLDALRLGLSVTDGQASATGDVMIRFYRPTLNGDHAALADQALTGATLPDVAAPDQARVRMYLLARQKGLLAWDFSTQLPHASVSTVFASCIFGGNGADQITGSTGADYLNGGAGNDALTGGLGADHFLITGGNDTLTDFDPAQSDVIELGGLFTGTATDLRSYVKLSYDASGATLGLDLDGIGTSFNDITVRLTGRTAADGDLFTLFHTGRIVAPGKTLPPTVAILATTGSASENGPRSGVITLSRLGPVTDALSVSISIAGSASNGTDYELIESPVVIPANQSTLALQIVPYPDAIAEPTETVQINLQSSPEYIITGSTSAQVSISDLLPEISVEALEPLAVVNPLTPGMILLTRSGPIDRSVLVRLTIAGNATPNTDYVRLPTFVNFSVNQTTALLPVTPTASPVLTNNDETVQVSLKTDTTYRTGESGTATVHIVPLEQTFAEWSAQQQPAMSANSLLGTPSPVIAPPTLFAYAFKNRSYLPQAKLSDSHLTIDFLRDFAASDLIYTVEFSTDLVHWTTGSTCVQDITPATPTDARRCTWQAVRSTAADPKQFLRVRVDQKP